MEIHRSDFGKPETLVNEIELIIKSVIFLTMDRESPQKYIGLQFGKVLVLQIKYKIFTDDWDDIGDKSQKSMYLVPAISFKQRLDVKSNSGLGCAMYIQYTNTII